MGKNNKLPCFILGGIIGAFVGLILYSMLLGFFGDTWSTAEGGPAIVIYSPIFVPLLVGAISGLSGSIGASIIASVVSGIYYLITGIFIIIIGALFSVGLGSLSIVFIINALLGGSVTVIVVVCVEQ